MFSLKEKIDLLEGRISRANLHWSFIFTIDLAVVGWALTAGENISQEHLYMFICVLVVAYVFIFMALLRSQSEMIALEQDIATELKNADQESRYLTCLKKPRFRHIKQITWPVYWGGNLTVIVFLWQLSNKAK